MQLDSTQVISGPKGLPGLGVAHRLLRDPLAYQEQLVREHGRLNRIRLGSVDMLLLHDAEAIDELLRTKGKLFGKASVGMAAVEPLLGDSLPSLTDMQRWRFAHDTLMPLFTPKALNTYWSAAAQVVAQEKQRMAALADAGEPFDLYVFLHEAMFRILMRTIFSGDFKAEEIEEMVALFDAQTAYISARYLSNCSPLIHLLPAVRRGKRALDSLNDKVQQMIQRRQAQAAPEQATDMLDALLAARHADGSPLSFKELRDNCMAMLFGGHETTAGTTTWTLGLLSQHPDIREAVAEEAKTVFADGVKDYAQVRGFDLIERCLDEAMRLYPMFPFLTREALQDTELAGHAIQKGQVLAFSAWTTHRDPRYWPDPQRFDPERHTAENRKTRPNAAFLPFSSGLRRCVGERVGRMEAYLLISMITQEFQVDLLGLDLPQAKVALSIKPDGGMPVIARRRQPN